MRLRVLDFLFQILFWVENHLYVFKLEGLSVFDPVIKVLSYRLISVDGKPITIGKILLSVLFLTLGVYLTKVFMNILREKVLDRLIENRAATHAIQNITFYIIVIFMCLLALQVANIPITIFMGIGGAFAIAAGLGAQNIANNFISGLILLIERPVKIGDFIIVGNIYGRVEDIGMRSTKVNSIENKHLIIPNSKLVESNVDNWTHNSRRVKSEIKVGVQYGSDVELVRRLLVESIKESTQTLKSREPMVFFDNFGDSSLEMSIVFDIKVNSLLDERKIKSDIRFTIDKKFKEANIVISFPQRDVHLFMGENTKTLLERKLS